MQITENNNFKFLAISSKRFSIELNIKPKHLYYANFYGLNENVILEGYSDLPFGTKISLVKRSNSADFFNRINFLPDFDEESLYWRAYLPRDKPFLYLPGLGGGLFKYDFKFIEYPNISESIFLDKDTVKNTYLNSVNIYGNVQVDTKVSSNKKSARITNPKTGRFVWDFESDKNSGDIVNNIIINNKWKAPFSIHKSYSNLLSLKIAGMVVEKKVKFLGEIQYDKWFESLLGSTNKLFSVQRWGVSMRGFSSLKGIDKNSDSTDITDVTLNLKYRFNSGVWDLDNSVGAVLGSEYVRIHSISASVLGLGFFWSRPLPIIFEKIFDYLPFMIGKKFVDFDIIKYNYSFTNRIKLNNFYAVNFQGKVFWKDNIFGHLGFGMKSYAFEDTSIKYLNDIQTLYGTIGIGITY